MLKKLNYVKIIFMLTAILLFVGAAASCGGGDNETEYENSGKIPFTPTGGIYTIYTEPGWATLAALVPSQLSIWNQDVGNVVSIDCFEKSIASVEPEPGVANLDEYVEYYKGFELAASVYGADNENEVGTLDELDTKNKAILQGKRQKAFGAAADGMTEGTTAEIIYIETADYYFSFSFGNANSKFEEAQQIVNDMIESLTINK